MTIRRSPVLRVLRRLRRDGRGATAIEYGLICALIVIAMIAGLNALAGVTIGMWGNVSDAVQHNGPP